LKYEFDIKIIEQTTTSTGVSEGHRTVIKVGYKAKNGAHFNIPGALTTDSAFLTINKLAVGDMHIAL